MAYDIGIDLGTTFSALAVAGRVDLQPDYPGRGIYLAACNVTLISSPYGEATFPSVIAPDPEDPMRFIFGADAAAAADDGGEPILCAKRWMGTEHRFTTPAGVLSAGDVAALFLGYLRECAQWALGEKIERAVVTHPAYFDRIAVEDTRQAAITAGFDMSLAEQMLMEPVAAALSYTAQNDTDPLRVLAYDLGGGTFDVSFLERANGVISLRSFDGNNLLGGYNFDRALAQWIIEAVAVRGRSVTLDQESDGSRIARLLQLAERVKIELAEVGDDDQPVRIRGRGVLQDDNGRELPIDEKITRNEFTEIIRDYLSQTISHCQNVLERADAGLEDIDLVLLVGGSSRGPWVKQALQRAFPNAKTQLFEPDLCVAAGAALYGARMLPQSAVELSCELSLDVPRQSAMEEVDIAGGVSGVSGGGLVRLFVEPEDTQLAEQALDAAGQFLFADQYLQHEGSNTFRIDLADATGAVLLQHPFVIDYAPDSEETTIVSVLPRALLIETVNGLIPIAAAGAALPVHCEESFERQNSNPSLTFRLFQDRLLIGEVKIVDIPDSGGAGSRVELGLDIQPSGELVGEALIYSPQQALVLRAPVTVLLSAVAVPTRDELLERYATATARWQNLEHADPQSFNTLRDAVSRCAGRIEKLFAQVIGDDQEISAEIEALEFLIEPEIDDMSPPLADFQALIAELQSALQGLKDTSLAAVATDATRSTRHGRVAARKFDRLQAATTLLVEVGEQAHQQRDRRSWAKNYVDMQLLLGQALARPDDNAAPPANHTRMQGSLYLNEQITRLNGAADKLAAEGRLQDWQSEVRRIFNGLHVALQQVVAIPDSMSAAQALAIRQQAEEGVRPLVAAINNLGVDLALVGASAILSSTATSAELDTDAALSLLGAGHTSLAGVLSGDQDIVNRANEQGNTPLMIAASNGDMAQLSYLLEAGAGINIGNHEGRTALFFCTTVEDAQYLITKGADIHALDKDRVNALLLMVSQGLAEVAQLLLEHGAEIESAWSAGQTPLLVAARAGALECVALLVNSGANVAARCENQRTALHHAAESGAVAVTQYLLGVIGDIDAVDIGNMTPLFVAAHHGHSEIVRLLLDAGADPHLRRAADQATPLMTASWQGHVAAVEALIARYEQLDEIDHDGDSALISAANQGHPSIVRILAGAGANLDIANYRGQTALMVATALGSIDMVQCLLELGADQQRTDLQGETALDYARAAQQSEKIELLSG